MSGLFSDTDFSKKVIVSRESFQESMNLAAHCDAPVDDEFISFIKSMGEEIDINKVKRFIIDSLEEDLKKQELHIG